MFFCSPFFWVHIFLWIIFICLLLLLDILFICISNVILFSSFPSKNPLSHPCYPCFYEVDPSPTHLLLSPHTSIPLQRGIEPSQDPLMPNKTILCHSTHGSLHVYSLAGGLVPGISGESGWLQVIISISENVFT